MLLRLNEKWGVGRIENPPQWTLCRRKISKGLETWVAVSFCQTRSALLRCIREEVIRGGEFYPGRDNMPVSADILAKIEDFPDRIG